MYNDVDPVTNKRHELEVKLSALKPDIIGLTESKPKNTTNEITIQASKQASVLH